jgi:hypothetical protein
VVEGAICFAVDAPCELSGTWLPVVRGSDSTLRARLDVDWIGDRTVWIAARFRDSTGQPILASLGHSNTLVEVVQASAVVKAVLDETTPIEHLPPSVQDEAAAVRAAYPVTGSVLIENGASMVGGVAGTSRDVKLAFQARSPNADVNEMRLMTGFCRGKADLATQPWEPFAAEKVYSIFLQRNISGFYVSVQYRDAQGGLSRVYCDDISAEGMPPSPSSGGQSSAP